MITKAVRFEASQGCSGDFWFRAWRVTTWRLFGIITIHEKREQIYDE
jgi:hypothetical protein